MSGALTSRRDHHPPRRPDFADVACGFTRGAATGTGALPVVGFTFDEFLWLEKSGTAVRCFLDIMPPVIVGRQYYQL
ncbi:MAG: hypothetical protein IT353_08890 [Gemmatimonadaceae bacterium]|nr:hypothetical protein [Gemmatimonadaceae bacterium]